MREVFLAYEKGNIEALWHSNDTFVIHRLDGSYVALKESQIESALAKPDAGVIERTVTIADEGEGGCNSSTVVETSGKSVRITQNPWGAEGDRTDS